MKPALLGVSLLLWLPSSLAGDELETLIQEYNKLKAQVGRGGRGLGRGTGRGDSEGRVEEVLDQIGQLGTDAAIKFLIDELGRAPEALAVLSARAALKSTHPQGPNLVVGLLGKRPPKVSIAVLDAIDPQKRIGWGPWQGRQRRAGVDLDWKKVEKELLQASRDVREVEVKQRLVPVLARGEGVAAAKALVQVSAAGSPLREGEEEVQVGAVEALVKVGKQPAAREWLLKEALSVAGSNPGMLAVVVEAGGRLSIAELRPRFEDLLAHDAERVAVAVVEALSNLPGDLDEAHLRTVRRQLNRKLSNMDRARILDSLARDGGRHALEVVLDSARSGDPVTRAIAMGSLGIAAGNAEVVQALLTALDDKALEVRSNALRALRKMKEKAVIRGLIEFLDKEAVDRLKADALRLLVDFTGYNMGFVAADWRKWWEGAERDFTFAEKEKKDKEQQPGTRVVTKYFGIEVASKRIAFLLDVSASMEGARRAGGGDQGGNRRKSKLDLLKEELTRLLKEMSDDSQVNIITFDEEVRTWSEQLRPLSRGGRDRAIEFVRGLRTAPQTNVFDSLEIALKDRRVDTIYLLTDGKPTTGRYTEVSGILRGVQELNRVRSVTIHCIAFGEDSDLLKQLADQNGGAYRFVEAAGQGRT